jgi:hypothetical protein
MVNKELIRGSSSSCSGQVMARIIFTAERVLVWPNAHLAEIRLTSRIVNNWLLPIFRIESKENTDNF